VLASVRVTILLLQCCNTGSKQESSKISITTVPPSPCRQNLFTRTENGGEKKKTKHYNCTYSLWRPAGAGGYENTTHTDAQKDSNMQHRRVQQCDTEELQRTCYMIRPPPFAAYRWGRTENRGIPYAVPNHTEPRQYMRRVYRTEYRTESYAKGRGTEPRSKETSAAIPSTSRRMLVGKRFATPHFKRPKRYID
jgi:hypothetical protein